MLDDSQYLIQISDENISNFVLLDMRIDQPTKEFMQRAMAARGGGVRITVEPSHLMDFNIEAYKTLKDISVFQLWFKVSANGYGFNYQSMTIMDGEFSVRNAVYEIWKKCRVHSPQCSKLRGALHIGSRYRIHSRYGFKPLNDYSDVISEWY